MSTKPTNSRVKLTKTSVAQLAAPTTGQRFVRDSELKGFAVRITSGSKAFILEKRINGRVRRITLGRDGELTVAQARNRAQQLLGQIALGEDPVAARRRERARGVTLAEAYRDFLISRPRLSKATRLDYDRAFNVVLKGWQHRPLASLTGQMILNRHRTLAKSRGEHGANNYMRALRSIFNFAMDRYEDGTTGQPVLATNPVLMLTRTRSWYSVDRRQTLIKPHQLPAWYEALEAQRDNEHHRSMGDTVADFLLFILFTGLRRREAATLKWRDVDLKDNTFTVTKTKSRRPHSLPFSSFLQSLLIRRLGARTNEYVFPGYGGHGHLVEPKRQVRHIVEASGIPFTIHDLRRTFLTIADTLELSPYTIKRLANHSTQGDVTAGYIISDIERLRTPMERIEQFVLIAIGITESAEIVSLRSPRQQTTTP